MKFYRLSANKSMHFLKENNVIWCPKIIENIIPGWVNVPDVKKGDIFFIFFNGKIKDIRIAQTDAKKYTYQQGREKFQDWNKFFSKWSDNKEGYLLNLVILKNYTDLGIIYKPFINEFNEKFSTNLDYKIFDITGGTVQSFLLPLTENSANFLLQKCCDNPLISFQEEIKNYAE